MKKDFTPTSKELRDWADNPAASRMVPVSPTSLRAVADLLDAQEAEIAALKVERDEALASEAVYLQLCEDAKPFAESNIVLKDELAALKAGLAVMRDCFPAPAPAGALEDAWAEAMSMPECVPAYVMACVDAQANEIAALKADRDGWHQQASDRIDDALQFASERDEARAEIAALRQDALRYRDLRKAAVYGLPSCEGSSQKQAFLVITGYGDDESADLTDQAVDEAIAQAVQPKP